MNLWNEFLTNTDKEIYKWTHYFPIYERFLSKFKNQTVLLIEIGCGQGGSLQLWKRTLGPFARIVGIDIDPRCKNYEEDHIHIRIGDQGDTQFLNSIIEEFGRPDIVIDDGGHKMNELKASFDFLYPFIEKNGIYIVEDLHTCYWDEYGGGYAKPESFIEKAKNLVDSLNAEHSRGQVPEDEFTKNTLSICFYDSVVVFEKGNYIKKHAPIYGNKPGN